MNSRIETRLTLRPGQAGTRYLYDSVAQRRFKTVELIVDESPWKPAPRKPRLTDDEIVHVRIHWNETLMRSRALALGAIWRPGPKVWEMTWHAAKTLGLSDRVKGSLAHRITNAATRLTAVFQLSRAIYLYIEKHMPLYGDIYR